MRRSFIYRLLAAPALALALSVAAQSATPEGAAPQPFRKLEFSRIGPWEVAAIGNDEKVNHCALTRGTASPELKSGEPQFTMIADAKWMILRVRAAEYQFTEKKGLPVTVVTAEGAESKPLAASGGSNFADIRFTPEEREALLRTRHLNIRIEDSTVRLSFAGLDAAKPAFDECMANIGTPAKGWSSREIDQLVSQVKRGKAKCTENKRTRVTMCDVD
jgi:hypothetical protein